MNKLNTRGWLLVLAVPMFLVWFYLGLFVFHNLDGLLGVMLILYGIFNLASTMVMFLVDMVWEDGNFEERKLQYLLTLNGPLLLSASIEFSERFIKED